MNDIKGKEDQKSLAFYVLKHVLESRFSFFDLLMCMLLVMLLARNIISFTAYVILLLSFSFLSVYVEQRFFKKTKS